MAKQTKSKDNLARDIQKRMSAYKSHQAENAKFANELSSNVATIIENLTIENEV